ncbi:hypothetical protein ABIE58_002317 [Roseovarius sp. MBR-78]|jgi:hypothetical protein|uniref:hypothetical protein n=1 Tax=Roseovarius sp. MBR-78 TaxID=3156460 RepID=UPI0033979EE4
MPDPSPVIADTRPPTRRPVFDTLLLSLVIANILALIVFHMLQTDVFHTVYAIEDGPAEWATTVLLLASFTVLARQVGRFAAAGKGRGPRRQRRAPGS